MIMISTLQIIIIKYGVHHMIRVNLYHYQQLNKFETLLISTDASVVVVPLVRWGDLTEIDIALTAWTVIDGCYGTKGKTSNVPLALLLAHMYAMWTVRVPPEIDASSPTLRENARVSHSSSTLSSSSRTGRCPILFY